MSDSPASVPPLTLHQTAGAPSQPPSVPPTPTVVGRIWTFIKWTVGICLTLGVVLVLLVMLGFAVMYPRLPDVSTLQDYRPKLPLRIYSSDGVLIGEYGPVSYTHLFVCADLTH